MRHVLCGNALQLFIFQHFNTFLILLLVENTLFLQGEQDRPLICQQKFLIDCAIVVPFQQFRFVYHPVPSFLRTYARGGRNLFAVFPGAISSLTEMRFFFLGTLALLKRSWPASPKKRMPPAVIYLCGRLFFTYRFHKKHSKR